MAEPSGEHLWGGSHSRQELRVRGLAQGGGLNAAPASHLEARERERDFGIKTFGGALKRRSRGSALASPLTKERFWHPEVGTSHGPTNERTLGVVPRSRMFSHKELKDLLVP